MLFCSNSSFALTTLYQKETETKISSGTVLKNYNLFTDADWLNINILKINLKDKYTNLELLTSSDGAGKLKNILSMAKDSNAIAAINGDFFAGRNGKGHSIGLSINDSDIISSSALENLAKDTFASFLLNEDNEVFFEYIKTKAILTSKKTKESIEIGTINKFSDNYAIPALFTSDWGEYSLGSSEGLILTEMVVKNNEVVEIRYNESATQIPKNGFVISTLGAGADFINNNFKKGTKIDLDISLSPEIKDINFAISGGAKLIDEGEIPEEFSHNISGRNPRTALGVDEDNENLYLITVDGRQNSSIGMTQLELSEFLKSIDIYNAINLDGGGSTTIVAQKLGESSLSTINKPSDGSLRSVINGIGVFSTAPNSKKLYGLNIEVDDTNIFKGETREIKVTGYNKYFNPVEIDFDDIAWECDGVDLIVEDNKISGNTVGSCILTAAVGKIETQIEINILSDANELFISPKQIAISPNEKVNYTIQAKNKNGYYAKTDIKTILSEITEFYINGIKQKEIPTDAQINNQTFTAKTPGDYVIAFSKGDITSYAVVTIAAQKAITLDNFEKETFKFDEYPDEVLGNATLSTEEVYSGKTSVKLEYDFNQDIQIRGAYIELLTPLTIPKDATSLSFWLFNDSYKDEQVKIKLKDANGNTKLIVLQDNISHQGWKEIKYDLSSISLPATLSDIYLAQDKINIKNTGYIYVDNLVYYTNNPNELSKIQVPKDIKLEDQTNTSNQDNENMKIALIDTIKEPELMIDNLRNTALINSINNNADLTILTTKTDETLLKNIQTKKIISKNYDLMQTDFATFITMDISNKSIRTTNSEQYLFLKDDVIDSDNKNIFIVLNDSIDNFTDLNERKLFIDMLCELKRETKKNIMVFHSGHFTGYTMERGVKFLGINTTNISPENLAKYYSYILITVSEDNIYYEIQKIF